MLKKNYIENPEDCVGTSPITTPSNRDVLRGNIGMALNIKIFQGFKEIGF